MSVAVLVVNFRAYDDLDRSLTSLGPFLSTNDEVVVVDNESDPKQLARLTARHPRMRAIPSERNLGFAAGVNLAARQSTKPILLLLNPDTVVQGPVVRVLEQWLIDHPKTGVAGPRVLNTDGSVQPSARRFPGISAAIGGRSTWLTSRFPNNPISRRNLSARPGSDAVDVDWIAGSCLMTTRAAFDAAGGFDERFFLYWEDADYGRRLQAMGMKSTYVPAVSVTHAAGRSSGRVPATAIRAFHESALRLHLKHGGRFARWSAPLAALALRIRMAWCLWRADRPNAG